MNNLKGIIKELRARSRKFEAAASVLAGLFEKTVTVRQPELRKKKKAKRVLSEAGRRAISRAQKARWAKTRGEKGA